MTLNLEQALAELDDIVRCRCHEAYTGRGLRDPECNCDSAEAVATVRAALAAQQPETLAWGVVGDDGALKVSLCSSVKANADALATVDGGQHVVRVAIRVVEDET